ncbi:MAG TPA: hypothetical protein DCX06_09265 [Opitutae bacterium]|nr:hypothetical protein [Opitutae bacterium]
MKTTDPRDSLDQSIDSLLSSRPVQADSEFTNRVMAAFDAEVAHTTKKAPNRMAPIIKFALPIAAAVALALTLAQFNTQDRPATPAANLTAAEAQEIFLLGEGLDGLADISEENFKGLDLLSTLEALTFELES